MDMIQGPNESHRKANTCLLVYDSCTSKVLLENMNIAQSIYAGLK